MGQRWERRWAIAGEKKLENPRVKVIVSSRRFSVEAFFLDVLRERFDR